METIFVTGVNGFVGKHLVRELDEQGARVVGVGLGASAHPEIADMVFEYYTCDLTDQEAVNKLPWDNASAVICLAGLAQVGASFDNPERYKAVNVSVLANVCEYFISEKLSTPIVAISTGAVYDPKQATPLTETSKLANSGSPYSQSKILMEEAAEQFRADGANIVVARPFNHTGPGQESGFLIPDLYQKIVNARESGEAVKVGNLETRRDYTDVRDVVRAYAKLALAGSGELSSSVYNVCSGVSRSGSEILDEFKKHIDGIENVTFEVDEKLLRPNDPLELVGSNDLIHGDTDWQPQVPFDQTISDFIASKQARV